jgi:2-oxoglutarate ferredoxin oxidoreductase subunit delta
MAKKRAKAVQVNVSWCKQCGICIAFCQPETLKPDRSGTPRVINLETCTLCMLCELRCPDFAITVIEDKEVVIRDVATAAHAGE